MFNTPNIDVSLHHPYILLGGVICLLVITLWSYRYTTPPISKKLRIVLIFLRFFSLTFLWSLLFEPVLVFEKRKSERAGLAVLIDNSASMQIQDEGKSRGEQIKEMLMSPELQVLRKEQSVLLFSFSDSLKLENFEQLKQITFDGPVTDLSRSLQLLDQFSRDYFIGSGLILTDGNYNYGENPLRIAQNISFPLHTVRIGKAERRPDLIINRLFANEISYVGHKVALQITVRGPGFGGKRVSLALKEGAEILDSKTIQLPEQGLERTIELHFIPDHPGFQQLRVEVSPLDGELTYENNFQQTVIHVLKSQFRILLISGEPNPDLSFLKRILLTDDNIQLISRTQKSGSSFYESINLRKDIKEQVDCLILLDYPNHVTGSSNWNLIERMILIENVPFLLIAGKHLDLEKIRTIETLIPVVFSQKLVEQSIIPNLTLEGAIHPVCRIYDTESQNSLAWKKLAPIFTVWSGTKSLPSALQLISASPEKIRNTKHAQYPLLVLNHIGPRKAMVFLGHGIYRWDLLMWGIGSSNEVLKTFLENSIRWLVTYKKENPIKLTTNQLIYRNGEEIFASVQAYDETYRPIEGARVQLIIHPSNKINSSFELKSLGEGRYADSFRLFHDGSYQLIANAIFQGKSIGSDTSQITISPFNLEFIHTQANPDFLLTLSEKTGGQSEPPDGLSSILQSVKFPEREITEKKEFEILNLYAVMGIIILLLSFEWFIRKRKGMV